MDVLQALEDAYDSSITFGELCRKAKVPYSLSYKFRALFIARGLKENPLNASGRPTSAWAINDLGEKVSRADYERELYLKGMSAQDIADKLGITVTSVYAAIRRIERTIDDSVELEDTVPFKEGIKDAPIDLDDILDEEAFDPIGMELLERDFRMI